MLLKKMPHRLERRCSIVDCSKVFSRTSHNLSASPFTGTSCSDLSSAQGFSATQNLSLIVIGIIPGIQQKAMYWIWDRRNNQYMVTGVALKTNGAAVQTQPVDPLRMPMMTHIVTLVL